MFNYVCLGTNDIDRSVAFYDAALSALGLSRCEPDNAEQWVGWRGWGTFEDDGATELALWVCEPFDRQPAQPGNGVMVALRARTWLEVDVFHAMALAHGGTCEGTPGLRPQYGDDFYAAYVRDPDGNKIAAVCRGFTSSTPGMAPPPPELTSPWP